MERETKKEILGFLFKENVLVAPDFVKALENTEISGRDINSFKEIIKSKNIMIANKEVLEGVVKLLREKPSEDKKGSLQIVYCYEEESKKRGIPDFIAYFNARYNSLKQMLMFRKELKNTLSINRLPHKSERETVSVIGMVNSKDITSNGNIILELEDPSGFIKVLVNKNNPDLFKIANNIVLDEVIGVCGTSGDRIIFSNKIIFPEVPIQNELKKSPEEEYALFMADIHAGSDMFMKDKFEQFLKWINAEVGNEEQKEIARKVKYIFMAGDLVDGVGIYPGQESELYLRDIYEQYEECAKLLSRIPEHIHIIISSGNHDAMRIAEPQPVLEKDYAESLWNLPNVTMVSNPAIVNIGSTEKFPGMNVMLYHGYSFDYYVANVESIRNNGGYHNIDNLMKFLMQKRHLAPTHTSTLYIPDTKKDHLVIDKIPDFFVTGHTHGEPKVTNHKNITLISAGCWQSITPFQEKVGHTPDPAKIPLVNLQTRDARILKF